MSYEEMVQKFVELSSKDDLNEKEKDLLYFISYKLDDYNTDVEYSF